MREKLRRLLERIGIWCLAHSGKDYRDYSGVQDRENLGHQLLKEAGSKVCVLSIRITPYLDEITRLCENEERFTHVNDDVLGSGYFRARRVMTKMKIAHPDLRVRDLWKAVDYCSGLIASGPKQTQGRRHQA